MQVFITSFTCNMEWFTVLCFRNLAKSQQRLVKLGNALDKVDREVAEMRKRYELASQSETAYDSSFVVV